MPDSPSASSPLTRLVLFMIFLSVAGSIVAGVHYYTLDLPQQEANEEYARCSGGCISSNVVISTPLGPQSPTDEACQEKCRTRYLRS